jgi:hypothetical protein
MESTEYVILNQVVHIIITGFYIVNASSCMCVARTTTVRNTMTDYPPRHTADLDRLSISLHFQQT